jgi:hypothetical protein
MKSRRRVNSDVMFLQSETLVTLIRRLIALIALFSLFSPAIAQSKASFEQRLVAAEKRVIWEAVAKKEMDVLRRSLAGDYLDVSDVGIFTKSETLKLIPDLTLRDYSLDKFKVIKLNRDAGVVTYEAIQHWTIKGQEAPSHVRAPPSGSIAGAGGWSCFIRNQLFPDEL